jgi:hypothetical protein
MAMLAQFRDDAIHRTDLSLGHYVQGGKFTTPSQQLKHPLKAVRLVEVGRFHG